MRDVIVTIFYQGLSVNISFSLFEWSIGDTLEAVMIILRELTHFLSVPFFSQTERKLRIYDSQVKMFLIFYFCKALSSWRFLTLFGVQVPG